jgi:hypothetical protein
MIELDLVRPLTDQLIHLKLLSSHQCELNVPFTVKCVVQCLRKGTTYLFSLKEQPQEGIFITSKSSLLVAFNKDQEDTKTLEFELLPFKTGLFKLPEITVQLLDGRLH